jgi:predicted aspartyl protease
MRFNGEWLLCDDGIRRPVMRAEVLSRNGQWKAAELLVDTGADRSVLSANIIEAFNLETSEPQTRIGGVGGLVESVTVTIQIRLTRDDDQKVLFRGSYAGCIRREALDMSVLGRDVLEMFSVIIDRPANVVAILDGNHYYAIHQR